MSGINLLSLVWSDGAVLIPCDFRIYDKPWDGKDKNQRFREMLEAAHGRGFQPSQILFDSWYSSLEGFVRFRGMSPNEPFTPRFHEN